MMNLSELNAFKRWELIPENHQKMILENVWCSFCKEPVPIIEYNILNEKHGILLQGKCKKCGGAVCRLVEDE